MYVRSLGGIHPRWTLVINLVAFARQVGGVNQMSTERMKSNIGGGNAGVTTIRRKGRNIYRLDQ